MAIADGGELLILAPGIKSFGENEEVDSCIRKYGYSGTETIQNAYENGEFNGIEMAAADLSTARRTVDLRSPTRQIQNYAGGDHETRGL